MSNYNPSPKAPPYEDVINMANSVEFDRMYPNADPQSHANVQREMHQQLPIQIQPYMQPPMQPYVQPYMQPQVTTTTIITG